MSFDRAHQEQKPDVSADGSQVTRVHIFAGALLRMGLEQIFEGTRFVVTDVTLQDVSRPSCFENAFLQLFIVDEKYRPDGITDLVAQLKTHHAAARVIVLSDQFDLHAVASARKAGADGFCLTTSSRDVLIRSIELVMLGEVVVPSQLVTAMLDDNMRIAECQPEQHMEKLTGDLPRRPLSSREIEVLSWLREGAPNKVIARRLNMAEATVKVHVKAILRKIGAHNRSQAAIWATHHLPFETTVR